jgi:hypothetical protein
MRMGLQNYVFIMPDEKGCIEFNNNKLNSLRRYGLVQNYRIVHRVVQHFSTHNPKISHQRYFQKLRQ